MGGTPQPHISAPPCSTWGLSGHRPLWGSTGKAGCHHKDQGEFWGSVHFSGSGSAVLSSPCIHNSSDASLVRVLLTWGLHASPVLWAGTITQKEWPRALAVPCTSGTVGDSHTSALREPMCSYTHFSCMPRNERDSNQVRLAAPSHQRNLKGSCWHLLCFLPEGAELTSGNCPNFLPCTYSIVLGNPDATSSFCKSPSGQPSLLLPVGASSVNPSYSCNEYPPCAWHVG